MIDPKLVILFFSPNLLQFGLNLSLKNLDQLPIRLHQCLLRLDFRYNAALNVEGREEGLKSIEIHLWN
jgi:hypothetical protein